MSSHPAPGYREKRIPPTWLHPPFRLLSEQYHSYQRDKVPVSLLFSRLNTPSSLTHSSSGSRPFPTSSWTHSSTSMFLLSWRNQTGGVVSPVPNTEAQSLPWSWWTHYFCSSISTKWRKLKCPESLPLHYTERIILISRNTVLWAIFIIGCT